MDAAPDITPSPVITDAKRDRRLWTLPLRHWRGELSLPVSYWVVSFFGSLIVVLFELGLAALLQLQDFSPLKIFFVIALCWSIVVVEIVWQVVGTWRSANNYRRRRAALQLKGAWAGIAQAMLVLGVLSSAGTLVRQAVPQLSEAVKMAFLGDPDMPAYALRLMRNASELEIAGGFKYGLADALERMLDDAPQVAVIHLNSVGGRVGEAKRVAEMIKQRGLATYTSSLCASACLLPYLAGRQRWLGKGARLGFHEGAFGGTQVEYIRAVLAPFHPSDAFVKRAASTPISDLWYPTESELLDNDMITGFAGEWQFAMSGFGTDLSPEKFAAVVKAWPLYGSLAQADPPLFEASVKILRDSYLEGDTLGDVLPKMRDLVGRFLKSQMPLADDATIEKLGDLLVKQFTALRAKSPAACYALGAKGQLLGDAQTLFGPALVGEETALDESVLRTATARPRPTPAELQPYQQQVFGSLQRSFPQKQLQLLSSTAIAPQDYGGYCDLLIALFQDIEALPEPGRAMLLRNVFWAAQGPAPAR